MIKTPKLAFALLLLGSTPAPQSPSMPRRVASCAFTMIRSVGQRLEDGAGKAMPNSGSAVMLANGVYGVSYDQEAAVNRSRPGDPAMTCLVKIPKGCPVGDDRGRLYTTTKMRTEESWTLPDASHMCGGA